MDITRRSALLGSVAALAGCASRQQTRPVAAPMAPAIAMSPVASTVPTTSRFAGFLAKYGASADEIKQAHGWHAMSLLGTTNVTRNTYILGLNPENRALLRKGVHWQMTRDFFVSAGVPEAELGVGYADLAKFLASPKVGEVAAKGIDFSNYDMSRVNDAGKVDLSYHRSANYVAERWLYYITNGGIKIYLVSLGCLNFIVPRTVSLVAQPVCIPTSSGRTICPTPSSNNR